MTQKKPAASDKPLLPKRRVDPYWQTLEGLSSDEKYEEVMRRKALMKDHPDHQAKTIVLAALTKALFEVHALKSQELYKLVFLLREVVGEHRPGEPIEHTMQPLVSIFSQRGGGRPRRLDHESVRRFHKRIASEHDAIEQTAGAFGCTRRAVSKILAGK